MKQTKQRPSVVLFDFDGTLSGGDTNIGFWWYCMRHSLRPWLFLPAALAGVVVKMIAGVRLPGAGTKFPRIRRIDLIWRHLLRLYLTPGMVARFASGFVKQHLSNRFGWAAEQVAKERAGGNMVILTSASADFLLVQLVNDMKFDYIIGSCMNPARPWQFMFFNYGVNKVAAIEALLKNCDFNVVRAYSDSSTDLPMMSLAKEQVWINPKTGCRI